MRANLDSIDWAEAPLDNMGEGFAALRYEIMERSFELTRATLDPEFSMYLPASVVAEIKAKYDALLVYVGEVEKKGKELLAAKVVKGVPIVGDVQLVIGDVDKSTLPEGVLNAPVGREYYNPVCVKIVGEDLLVVDRENHLIDIYGIKDGSWKRSIGGTADVSFQSPTYALEVKGKLFVSDLNNGRLKVIDYE
jgi:hypothetical protein